MEPTQETDFTHVAQKPTRGGLIREFIAFCLQNKKWWLFPILIVLLLLGMLIMLSGTAVAPFVYTMF